MTVIVDAAPVAAQAEPDHPYGPAARRFLLSERGQPIMPAPIATEVDYLFQARGGLPGNRTFIRDLAAGRFLLPCLEPSDYITIAALNEQYRDLNVGLADLSIVIMAARFRTTRILTFDQRHFRVLRPLLGGTFTLLPFDEP